MSTLQENNFHYYEFPE